MSNADKNWKNKALREVTEFDFETIRQGRQIPVAELRMGHEIITSWTRSGGVKTSSVVKERVPCPGHNGLHVHINKSNCYDSRANVWIK